MAVFVQITLMLCFMIIILAKMVANDSKSEGSNGLLLISSLDFIKKKMESSKCRGRAG